MEKFIIIAGSANCGKTITCNLTIKKLIQKGYSVEETKNGQSWEKLDKYGDPTTWSEVTLEKEGKKILLIAYGDIEEHFNLCFNGLNIDEYYAIVCCSRAARGKKVFNRVYDYIGKLDLDKTQVIPIYKNFLSHKENYKKENDKVSDLIVDLI